MFSLKQRGGCVSFLYGPKIYPLEFLDILWGRNDSLSAENSTFQTEMLAYQRKIQHFRLNC